MRNLSKTAKLKQSKMLAAGRKCRYEAQEREKALSTPEVNPQKLTPPAPGYHRCSVQYQQGNDPASFLSVTSPKGTVMNIILSKVQTNIFSMTQVEEPVMWSNMLHRAATKLKERKDWETANKCSSSDDVIRYKNYINQRAEYFPANPLKFYADFTTTEMYLIKTLSEL